MERVGLWLEHIRNLVHEAAGNIGCEIGEADATTGNSSLVRHRYASRKQPRHSRIIVVGVQPRRHMLEPFSARLQEVSIRTGAVVVLLDQLHLYVARIAERNTYYRCGRRVSAVAVVLEQQIRQDEERANTQHLRSVLQRGVEVTNHERDLSHRAEKATHLVSFLPSSRQ